METFLSFLIGHAFLKLVNISAPQALPIKFLKLPWKIMNNKALKKSSEDVFL